MKVGRPICEDRAYAEKVGVSYMAILRAGGARYLQRIPEESRTLILNRLKTSLGTRHEKGSVA